MPQLQEAQAPAFDLPQLRPLRRPRGDQDRIAASPSGERQRREHCPRSHSSSRARAPSTPAWAPSSSPTPRSPTCAIAAATRPAWTCGASSPTTDDDELKLTQNAQPALCFVGLGLTILLRRRGIEPAAAAGHSVGEYAALAASGAVGAPQVIKAVVERGKAMAEAAPAGTSSMAAVLGLDPQAVEAALAGMNDAWPANYNTPTQTVIAGTTAGLEAATKTAPGGRREAHRPAERERRIPHAADGARPPSACAPRSTASSGDRRAFR